ncbi:hypothetical protein [Xanthomonas phage X1]|nr:hypothetical protein [Xanthomonas phage X1]
MISPCDGGGSVDPGRAKFEEAVFRQYFIKHVGSDLRMKPGIVNKAEFCKRDENGNYVREEVSAMWFGWKLYQKENV